MHHQMNYAERRALFCSHATAVLTDDHPETERLHCLIYPDHALAHQVFVYTLFVACIKDHFGPELNWPDLDAFTTRLHRTCSGIPVLKAEALIRSCYSEQQLYFEVPQAEHNTTMWAVCCLATGDDSTGHHLTALYDQAETHRRQTIHRLTE